MISVLGATLDEVSSEVQQIKWGIMGNQWSLVEE